jgi:hypothetical protein
MGGRSAGGDGEERSAVIVLNKEASHDKRDM